MSQHPRRQSVKVAVIGVGHVGALHAQVYARYPKLASLVAVCDRDDAKAQEVASRLGCRAVRDLRGLIGQIDAASVCVPTRLHYAISKRLLSAGIHVLIEKPITTTLKEADALLAIATRTRSIVQVGHIERFNAAIKTAQTYLTHPRFIEVHRLSPYPFRGTDVSVVLDVMIHDLDLVLALVRSKPVRVDAVGVPVLSPSEDIANARVAFASGCVANLTASRVSDEAIRRLRVFQEDAYLSIDYKQQTLELARKVNGAIQRRMVPVDRRPPLDDQLLAFLRAVQTRRRPPVPGEEARQALALALRIERAMRKKGDASIFPARNTRWGT